MTADLFFGRYRVDRRLGEGGMGTVYLAHDENIDRYVAIKVMRSDSEELLRRFKTEAKAAGRLKHPNIVTVYDFAVFDGVPCLIMEYVEGETLAKVISRNAPMSMARKVELIEHACRGLAFAHKAGIVHRDIKPANLMIERDGTLKILDFGIARTATGSGTTGHIVGTVAYMSPEQALGKAVDFRSDIWALGLVLFELITGKLAFAGDSDYSILDRIVRGHPEPFVHDDAMVVAQLKPIVTKALAKDPGERYQNTELMAYELADARRKLMEEESSSPTIRLRATTVTVSRPHPAAPEPPAPQPPALDPPPPAAHAPAAAASPPAKAKVASPDGKARKPIAAAAPRGDKSAPSVPGRFWVWAAPGALVLIAGVWSLMPPKPAVVTPVDTQPTRVVEPAAPSPSPPTPGEPPSTAPITIPQTAPPEPPARVSTPQESRPADQPRVVAEEPRRAVDEPRPQPPAANYAARLAAARDAFEAGDYAVAVQRYEAILKEDAGNADATRGLQTVRTAQAAERKLFSTPAQSATLPIDVGARLAHARSRFEEGDYDAAISAYEEVLRADPRNARAQSGLGEARKAKAAEEAILKRPPKKPGG